MQPGDKGPLSSIGRLFSPFGSGLQHFSTKLQRFTASVSNHAALLHCASIHFNFTFHVVVFIDIMMSASSQCCHLHCTRLCDSPALTSSAFCLLPASTSGQQGDGSIRYSFFTVATTTFPRLPAICFATKADVGMQTHSSSAALDLISLKLSA
jgi:hypothetical protein